MPSRLAEHLVARGLVSAQQAAEALQSATEVGGSLEDRLLELRAVPETSMLHALAEVSGVRSVHLPDFEPNREMAALIPAMLAERFTVVPLSIEGKSLHVASVYPIRKTELDEMGFLLGKTLVLWVAPRIRIRDWMSALYNVALSDPEKALLASLRAPRALEAPTALAPPLPGPSSKRAPAEELTLEESLSREMTDHLRRVMDEPILLETKKKAPVIIAAAPTSPPSAPVVAEPPLEIPKAKELLQTVASREALLEVVMRLGLQSFDFIAALAVIRGVAAGWTARGDGADADKVAKVSIPLDAVSVFRTVALTRSSYLGPVPTDALSKAFLESLGRAPRTVFLFPIEVKGRLVALLYGDGGQRPLSQRKVADFVLFCQDLSPAFERLILARRQEMQGAKDPNLSDEFLLSAPPASSRSSWSPQSPDSSPSPGRALGYASRTQSENERPPPDFEPILKRLVGPDAAQRARAMAELARSPEASAKVLCSHFPGPTGWAKSTVSDLPEADELGPIPGALSRLGRAAAERLADLLDDDSPERRYFALLTAGCLPYPELVPGLLRGLFDLDSDVSSAARAASASFRRLPRFDASLRSLRQELTSIDPLRRSLAARALGALHDREAIDGLIGLTASDDELCSQSAAQALSDITLATFGLDSKGWSRWWAENRARRRGEWLLAALRGPSLEQRTAALEEVARITGDPYGYSPDGAPAQRELALKKWEVALVQDPRLRRVD